ncbi:MAG TPA: maleylpyruvate isomerase N-terminal domain-containing protein [Actinomycetes bacterium]
MTGVDSDVVVVTHLFPPERASVLQLLSSLDAGQWQAPTVCPGWSVKDVALHLLGGDIDLLSRRRDGHPATDAPTRPAGFQELVASLTGWMWPASTPSGGPTSSRSATRLGCPG